MLREPGKTEVSRDTPTDFVTTLTRYELKRDDGLGRSKKWGVSITAVLVRNYLQKERLDTVH